LRLDATEWKEASPATAATQGLHSPFRATRESTSSTQQRVAAVAGLALFPIRSRPDALSEAAFPYQVVENSKCFRVTEGPTTTLQLLRRERFGEATAWRLLTDSFSMTAINRYALRYMEALRLAAAQPAPGAAAGAAHQLWRRHNRAGAASDPSSHSHGGRTVTRNHRREPVIHGDRDPLRDPRVRLVREDGRAFPAHARRAVRIITAGAAATGDGRRVNLYTKEYFARARRAA